MRTPSIRQPWQYTTEDTSTVRNAISRAEAGVDNSILVSVNNESSPAAEEISDHDKPVSGSADEQARNIKLSKPAPDSPGSLSASDDELLSSSSS